MENQDQNQIAEKIKLENQLKSGAHWFYWIAGLSLINSIIYLSGSHWTFVIGLGVTQFIDAIFVEVAQNAGLIGKIIAFIFDLIAASIFVVFGIFAGKKYNWSFIIGMVLYAFDGLLFIIAKDFLSIGFHVLALYFIYNGFKANKRIKENENKNLATTL